MASSLVKFMNRRVNGNGRGQVFWSRADRDGAPFRGQAAPMFTEEEFDEKLVRVYDPKNGVFDVTDKEENDRYLEILDGISNGWFQLVYINRQFDEGSRLVYVEWLESYMEDGSPGGAIPPLDPAKVENGQENGN